MDMVSPDTEQQKRQINYDLSVLMKRPIPAYPTPLAQGIGLYSHIAATADSRDGRTNTNAAFLPLGGPRKLQKWRQAHDSLPNEIKQAWNQLQQALDDEERASRNAGHHTTSLVEKYGGLRAPQEVLGTSLAHMPNKEGQNTSTDKTGLNSLKRRASSVFAQQPTERPTDAGVVTRNTPTEDAPSAGNRRHFYEADRDPRRRVQEAS
jgi:hypothetical protein